MLQLNKIQLTGRVGAIRTQQVQDGTLAGIRIAVSERYTRRDGQKVEDTLWLNVTATGSAGNFAAQYIGKGDLIYVEGRLRERTWTGRDGEEHKELEVLARDVQSIEKKKEGDDLPL